MADVRVIGEPSDGLEAVKQPRELKSNVLLLDIALSSLNGIQAST
jgi:DNA-binding NarL/FixJ family response regulator